MRAALVLLPLLISTNVCLAEPKVYKDNRLDLGISLSPTFTPQTGYQQASTSFGIELGWTLFRYEDKALVDPEPTIKFMRLGVGIIGGNTPVVIFTPFSAKFRNKVYLNPSLGFGKNPHSLLSLTYEIL